MDLQRIDISAFPDASGIQRKIAILGRNEDYQNRTVTLICGLEHYDSEGRRLRSFQALERDAFLLIASDTSFVDQLTGALVFPDSEGNYPEGSVGQYSWLKAAVENGSNPFEITQGAVLEADSLGRFT